MKGTSTKCSLKNHTLKLVRAQHFADEQIISAVVAKFYRAACQLSISGMQEEAVSSSVAPVAFCGNF